MAGFAASPKHCHTSAFGHYANIQAGEPLEHSRAAAPARGCETWTQRLSALLGRLLECAPLGRRHVLNAYSELVAGAGWPTPATPVLSAEGEASAEHLSALRAQVAAQPEELAALHHRLDAVERSHAELRQLRNQAQTMAARLPPAGPVAPAPSSAESEASMPSAAEERRKWPGLWRRLFGGP